jgi:uncharacterized protein YkwD
VGVAPLRRLPVLAILLVALLVAAAPAAAKSSWRHHLPPTHPESHVLRLLNVIRQAHGLAPLRRRDDLFHAARDHSRDMAKRDYFAHGAMLARLLEYVSNDYRVVGENLAWGAGVEETAASAVARWMASPPHRANILDPDYRFVGIGSKYALDYQGENGARVFTADFAG